MPHRIASIDIGEMASIANLKVEELARVVKRQSQPRRWPWQPKTLYDQAHERSGEVVALAADLPADGVPYLEQVLQAGAEHRFGVVSDLHLVLAGIDGR